MPRTSFCFQGSRFICPGLMAGLCGLLIAFAVAFAMPPSAMAAQPGPAKATVKQSGQSDWHFNQVGIQGVLYPSLVLSRSNLKLDLKPQADELGDVSGFFAISATAPRNEAKAVVEITSSTPLVAFNRQEVVLPRQDMTYRIYPRIVLSEAITLVRQPVAATFTARLWLDGIPQGERAVPVTIASVNDCVLSYMDDNELQGTTWLFAAYVNENHPAVQQIIREALGAGEVTSFVGYQADPKGVFKQVKAIWQALHRRNIHYSMIGSPTVKTKDVVVQYVRLLGEALQGRQANCVEGSCLLASLFYKIGLETALVVFPDHMLVSVALDPQGKQRLYLETTLLSTSTFEDAAKAGDEEVAQYVKEHKAAARKGSGGADGKNDDGQPLSISISIGRKIGIMPIPDRDQARQQFFMTK
jgi:hypothetical protein